jgi:hypothetical protein
MKIDVVLNNKQALLGALKRAFKPVDMELMKKIANISLENTEISDRASSEFAEKSEAHVIFDQIRYTFEVLNALLKYTICLVDEPKYQDNNDKDVVFPNDIESLTCILGLYSKAFSKQMLQYLFDIITYKSCADFFNISQIPTLLIASVLSEDIKIKALKADFDEFSGIVKQLACDVLKLNVELEPSIIEDVEPETELPKNSNNSEQDVVDGEFADDNFADAIALNEMTAETN